MENNCTLDESRKLGIKVSEWQITMLGLSRWSQKGGNYHWIEWLYYTVLPWKEIQWLFFRRHSLNSAGVYIITRDEVVVSKVGKETYRLDRFFSSLQQQVIPGLSFFEFSLVNAQEE